MSESQQDYKKLRNMVLLRLLSAVPVFMLVFFLPAGTWAYWQGWVYMVLLLTPMCLAFVYLLKNDPALLERRMRAREQQQTQRWVILAASLSILATYLLPGFDRRFGWSQVPVWLVIVGDVLSVAGYGIFLIVLRENSYASRVVEVEKDQTVISSGPYAVVRHPMYTGIGLMYLVAPLALGSYWALLASVWIVPVLIARIINEEKTLRQDLPGYKEYIQKTRYRLVPWIW